MIAVVPPEQWGLYACYLLEFSVFYEGKRGPILAIVSRWETVGSMIHGAELGHVGAVLASRRQWSTHLGAKICGTKNQIKSSKGLNMNILQKGLKYKKTLLGPRR